MVWFGLVWFGLVWDIIHPKLLWLFHQNPTCFACFREDWKLWVGWGGKQQSSLALKGAEQFLSTPFYVHGFFSNFENMKHCNNSECLHRHLNDWIPKKICSLVSFEQIPSHVKLFQTIRTQWNLVKDTC